MKLKKYFNSCLFTIKVRMFSHLLFKMVGNWIMYAQKYVKMYDKMINGWLTYSFVLFFITVTQNGISKI